MGNAFSYGLMACFLVTGSINAAVIVGSEEGGPVQLLDESGNITGTFGTPDGAAGAVDTAQGLFFVAVPGNTASTIDEYGASQNLLSSFVFTAPGDSRTDAAYITDLSWGESGTLWVATYSGEIYHLASDGTVLSSFDTGATAPGVAFDGTDLYTTSGPGFAAPSPFVYERTTSGTILNTIDTGLNDTLGIGYDGSNSTLWIGGFDILSQVDLSGNILQILAVDGTHYGVDVGDLPASVSTVPEASTLLLMLSGLGVLALSKAALGWRRLRRWLLCAAAAIPAMQATPSISSFTPNLSSPQPVGTTITFTVVASDTDSGALRYRFRVAPAGAALAMLRDYSPATSVSWTPIDTDGAYQVEVSVLNRSTGNTHAETLQYMVSARTTGAPVVNPTAHPLIALYSSGACPSGSSERVRFKLPTDALWQSTPLKPCNGTTSMNFYIAGMRATSTYQLRQDVINGPQVVSGPILNFTTGAIGVSLPATNAIVSLKPPSSLTESVSVFGGLDYFNDNPYAVDPSLNVLWYAQTPEVYLVRLVPGGGYFVIYGFTPDLPNSGFRQYDLAGNLVKETNVERMNDELAAAGMNPITTFHHEVRLLTNGNYLVLGQREVASSVQGSPNDIVGDMILVLDNNLQLLWAWDSFAHLDVTRPAVLGETCAIIPGQCVLFNSTVAHDWTHGNSAQLAPDGNIIYSSRHQDFVYKIAYQNGAGDGHVIWKLGKGGDFTWVSTDPYPWFSHQHDAEYQDTTTLSLFDDGNTRVQVEGGGNSRGQALHLDETNLVVTFILNQDLGAYSNALGSAQRLLNGNYVFDNGWINVSPNTQFSEWTTSGTEVSNTHSVSINYRCFRVRDLYSAPY